MGFTHIIALLTVFVTLIKLVEGVKSLPFGTVAVLVTVRMPCFVGSATCWTTLRLAGKAFRLEEFLFPGGESECSPAIGTLDRLAPEKSLDDLLSSLFLVGARVIQYLIKSMGI